MQAFKEREIKPYRYRNCPSNALKYHLDNVHSNEANRTERVNTGEMEGELREMFVYNKFLLS